MTGILGNLGTPFTTVDFTAKGNESDRKIFQKYSKKRRGQMVALAPQIFNDDAYCGDYVDFDLANRSGSLEEFLKLILKPCDRAPVLVDPLMVIFN